MDSQSHQPNIDFCMKLAKHVGLKEAQRGSNFVVSPLSVHVILSLIAAGSKGPTLEQMLSILNSESVDDLNLQCSQLIDLVSADHAASGGGPCLSFVNGVWVEKTLQLKSSYHEIVTRIYKAEARAVDIKNNAVEVTMDVNSWVENATNGLITELLPCGSLDSSTMLVLANALYFKGAWNKKFNTSATHNREFYLLDGNVIQVPFMTSKMKQFVRSFDGFKVLKLPYQQGEDQRQFSMYFFLPDDRDGLPILIEKLGAEPEFLNRQLSLREVELREFRLPRFKISFGVDASEIMKELGLDLPFSCGRELTEMVETAPSDQELCVWNVFHKSFVEVNEEGTEAAAATAGRLRRMCRTIGSLPVDFVADHPFMFMIREEMAGVVFFIGTVLNPLLND